MSRVAGRNAKVRIFRRSNADFDGDETRFVNVGETRCRVDLTREAVIDGEGVVRETTGTMAFDGSVDIVEMDTVQILEGYQEHAGRRFIVERVRDGKTITGRIVSKTADVTLDRARSEESTS